MKYTNEKLNITIDDSEYFNIDEKENYVELWVEGNLRFSVFGNSKVNAYSDSTVNAFDNSKVNACEFAYINRLSIGVKIETKNHFGAITGQVFILDRGITVYKKLRERKIAILELEKGQVFQSAHHDNCRTDHARVLRIESLDGKTQYENGKSLMEDTFIYEAGKVVSTQYDEQIKECSNGIHFFLTREKAEKFKL